MKTLPFTVVALLAGACSVDSGVRPRTIDDPSEPSAAASPYDAAPSTPSPRAASSAPLATTYVCPMHADVVRDAPGQCPRCGMTLVPQSPHAHAP